MDKKNTHENSREKGLRFLGETLVTKPRIRERENEAVAVLRAKNSNNKGTEVSFDNTTHRRRLENRTNKRAMPKKRLARSNIENSNTVKPIKRLCPILVDDRAMEEMLEALIVRDPEESKIGICGPGEIVKDTLTMVIRIAERDEFFHKIVIAAVTEKKPDLMSIQTQIGAAIGLNFADDDDDVTAGTGFCMCFGGAGNKKKEKKRLMISEERASLICSKLKEFRSVLVMLYDINGTLDLGQVGIPFGEHHQGCKILLTSSNEDVLSNKIKVHKQIHTMKSFV